MRLFWILLFAAAAGGDLSVRAVPAFVQPGGAVRITCRVQPDAKNRKIEFGVEDYYSVTRELDGEDAPITWERIVDHLPCGAGRAFCRVTRADRSSRLVVAPLEVIGCDDVPSR